MVAGSGPRVRRRRSGCGVGLVVFLVLLLGAVVVVDRVTVAVAEDRLAAVASDEARKAELSPSEVTVDVDGFPFLTQAAQGRFDGGTVVLRDVSTPSVRMRRVELTLAEVTMPRDAVFSGAPHDVKAATVRGRVFIANSEIARLFGLDSFTATRENGALRATMGVPVPRLGTIQVSGLVRPQLRGKRFSLAVDSLRAGNVDVPAAVVNRLSSTLRTGFDLPLPFPVRLDDVRPDGDALVVEASAREVTLVP